jgi:hypothetical protein
MAKRQQKPDKPVIEIPKLRNKHLGMLIVCGHIQSNNRSLLQKLGALNRGPAIIAPLGLRGQFVQLRTGQASSSHLHVDIFRSKYFPVRSATAKDDAGTVQRAVGQFLDSGISMKITGIFYLQEREVPQSKGFIGPAIQPDSYEGVTFRQTGGTVKFDRGPTMEWMLRRDGKEVRIEIELARSGRLDADYLTRAQRDIEELFEEFVLE